MNAINVREGTWADASAIAGIHVRSWQTAYRGTLPEQLLESLSVGYRAYEELAGPPR